jgi:hypothetical protein
MKYISISHEEVESLYRCISFAMDLRDEIEWKDEEQYWSKWDSMSKNISIALTATNKLAGYNTINHESKTKISNT